MNLTRSFFLVLAALGSVSYGLCEDLTLRNASVSVYFSPRGGAEAAVVAEVNAARTSVFVQAYSFTSAPIGEALKAAHDRGVRVEVILDKSQRTERYSGLTFLQHAGVPVVIDSEHQISHNKIIVVDGYTVIGGSFNFTKSAEYQNAENLIVIRDHALARIYLDNWAVHRRHSF